ncbi:MAG: metallophosphoesterase [Nanoarchaeota archaeon]
MVRVMKMMIRIMKISKGIEIIDLALWLQEENILIINDLHLGYEESLQRKGVLLPKFQINEIFKKLERILERIKPRKKITPVKIIINGDLKHEFGSVLKQEWKEVLLFLDFLLTRCQSVIIIKGNHDPFTKAIAEKKGIKIVKEYSFGDTLIVHGDALVKTKAKRIIIGHEHPAISLREGSKWEKYKCFLRGKWKGKELLCMPSFNPLLEGTDVLKEKLLSPFLQEVKDVEVYVANEGEVFYFGKIKSLL